VYLSWYPATAAVLLADRLTFRRAYAAYLAAFVVCVAVYPLFPVTIARPALPADQNLSVSALAWVYAADRPVNLFPSFHAAVAAILWRLRPASRFASTAVSAWVVALCLACVLTKQHYVLDVVAGLAVGGIAVAIVDLARSRFPHAAKLTPYAARSVRSETAE
jgi:membrane-associated phospholipid phosphatase